MRSLSSSLPVRRVSDFTGPAGGLPALSVPLQFEVELFLALLQVQHGFRRLALPGIAACKQQGGATAEAAQQQGGPEAMRRGGAGQGHTGRACWNPHV
jgi:hypothetical protein